MRPARPDVVGVVALAAACRRLREIGMDTIAAHERALAVRLWNGLHAVPGLHTLRLWQADATDRVGVATFTLGGYSHPLLAAILSAEHAIGVRNGCFCAHPLLTRLLGVSEADLARLRAELQAGRRPPLPGAVGASVGLGTTPGDIDRLTGTLHEVADSGPRWYYRRHIPEHDEYEPVGRRPAPATRRPPGRDRTLIGSGSRSGRFLHVLSLRRVGSPGGP